MSLFFKLFGLRYSNPAGPPHLNDKDYLSNLQFARTGDVLVDEDGNPISFGAIGIQYGSPPNPTTMSPEETGLWFNLATNSVWSRTKQSDGITIIDVDTGSTGGGDMLKSVYDSNNDGIVNAADQLKIGVLTATATQVINHIADLSIHRPMNDTLTTTTNLWSASKTRNEIDLATRLFDVGINGIVGAPTIPQKAGEYFLRADNSWQKIEIANFDLELVDLSSGDLLMYGPGGLWYNIHPSVGAGLELEATFGGSGQPSSLVLYNTLTLDQARLNGDTMSGPAYYEPYVLLEDPLQLVTKGYVDALHALGLAGLPDVSIINPTNEELLQYSSYEGKWINVALDLGVIAVRPHHMLQELDHDDHLQYLLLAGRAGGQYAFGGTGVDETLTLRGTSDASFGNVTILRSGSVDHVSGASDWRVYDAYSGYVAMSGTTAPEFQFYDPTLAYFWRVGLISSGTLLRFNDGEHDVLTINGVTHDVELFAGLQVAYTTTGLEGMIRYNSGSFQGYGPLGWQTFGGVALLSQLGDVDINSPEYGQFLIYDGYNWINAHPVLVTALSELTDVSLYEPVLGQILVYDGSKWVNQDLTFPVALSQLTDVLLTTPAPNEFLVFNGTKWVNQSLSETIYLSELADVTISAPIAGQVLTYNGYEWDNQTINYPVALAQLTDVDQVGEQVGDLLMRDSNGKWINVELLVGGVLTAQFDEYTRHLVMTASPGPYPGIPNLRDLTDVGPITYTAGNILIADGDLWQSHQMSGDATMNLTGVLSITPNIIDDADISLTADIAWTKISKVGSSLDDLGDVALYMPVAGESLIYNGYDWVNGYVDYPTILNRPLDDNFVGLPPIIPGSAGATDVFPTWNIIEGAYRTETRQGLAETLAIYVPHSSLIGLANDDHPQYYNLDRLTSWFGMQSINGLADVITDYAQVGDIMVYDGSAWHNTMLLTAGGASFVYDPVGDTLTLTTSTSPGSILDIYDRRHSLLDELTVGDDHTQYVHISIARTITARHTFNPPTVNSPFILGANALGQFVTGLNADQVDGFHASDFQPIDADLTALAGITSTGIIVRSAAATFVTRAVQGIGAAPKVAVTNGSGVGGNITLDVNEANLVLGNIGGTLPWTKVSKVGSSINDLGDVNTDYAVTGNLLVYTGSEWKYTTLATTGGITATYDGSTLLLGTTGAGVPHNTLSGLQGGSASGSEYYHLTAPEYSELSTFLNLPAGGFLVHTLSDTYVVRSLAVGSNKLSLTYGDGLSGNPTFDVNEANLALNNLGGYLGWAKVDKTGSSINDLGDVVTDYAVAGSLFMYNGSSWKNTALATSGGLTASYDGNTLLLSVAAIVDTHNNLFGLQGGDPCGSEYYHLDYATYSSLNRTAYYTVSASSTLSNNYKVVAQTEPGIVTTLWANPGTGDSVTIKNASGDDTILSGNGMLIEGNSSITLLAGEAVTVLYNGTQWIIVALGDASTVENQWVAPPASCTSIGMKGQLAYDGRYRYDCVSTNVWTRYAVEWTF